MKRIFLIFTFKDAEYHAVIRERLSDGGKEYLITVLNWPLERLLYGNHIIREINLSLQIGDLSEDNDQTELKMRIAASLSRYLDLPCFAGECLIAVQHANDPVREHLHPISRHYSTSTP